jgi:hypothetical protein
VVEPGGRAYAAGIQRDVSNTAHAAADQPFRIPAENRIKNSVLPLRSNIRKKQKAQLALAP